MGLEGCVDEGEKMLESHLILLPDHDTGILHMSSTQLSELKDFGLRLPEDLTITQDEDYLHLRVECSAAAVSLSSIFYREPSSLPTRSQPIFSILRSCLYR